MSRASSSKDVEMMQQDSPKDANPLDQNVLPTARQGLELRLQSVGLRTVPNVGQRQRRDLYESDRLDTLITRFRLRRAMTQLIGGGNAVERQPDLQQPPQDAEELQRQLVFIDLLEQQVAQRRDEVIAKFLIPEDLASSEKVMGYLEQNWVDSDRLGALLTMFLNAYSRATKDWTDNANDKLLLLFDVFLVCDSVLNNPDLRQCPDSRAQGARSEPAFFPGGRGLFGWLEYFHRLEVFKREAVVRNLERDKDCVLRRRMRLNKTQGRHVRRSQRRLRIEQESTVKMKKEKEGDEEEKMQECVLMDRSLWQQYKSCSPDPSSPDPNQPCTSLEAFAPDRAAARGKFPSGVPRRRSRLPLKRSCLWAARRGAALCAMSCGLRIHAALRTLPGAEVGQWPCAGLLWHLTRVHMWGCCRGSGLSAAQPLAPQQARMVRLFFRKVALRPFDNGQHTAFNRLVNALLRISLQEKLFGLRGELDRKVGDRFKEMVMQGLKKR